MFTPTVGQEGIYTVRAPYDKFLEARVIYRCEGVRSLNEIVASGEDPYKTYYEAYGATQQDFVTDVANNVNIVSLLAGTGNWVYVPASFIEGAPNASGEKYTPALISLYLGHVSESYPFDAVIDDLKGVIQASIGIDPVAKLISMGPSVLLTDADVERTRVARQAVMGTKPEASHAKAKRLEQEVAVLQETIKQLNKFIADNRL